MTWSEFLRQLDGERAVTLVGPLHDREFAATAPTIYVDGGSRFRRPAPFPQISVGDGDSSATPLDHVLPRDKDYSDLAFALRDLPASIEELTLLGFLGGRRDHELLNLGAVHGFLAGRSRFTRARFESVAAFAHGEWREVVNGTFSVVCFAAIRVRIGGACRYAFDGALPALASLGLSNVGSGLVTVASEGPCFVYLPG